MARPIFTIETFANGPAEMRYGKLSLPSGNVDTTRHPLVFIPGLGGSVKNALVFLERFVPHHGVVYSMDARGFGINEHLSPQPKPSSYLKDFQQFVLFLEAQNLIPQHSQPIIMGLSLGGVHTTLFTTTYNHPFKAQILVAPAFRPHPQLFTADFKLRNYSQVFLKGPWAMTRLPYGIRNLTRNPERYDDPKFQDPLVLPTFYMFLIDLLCKKAFQQSRRIQIPTAVVVPEADIICDPAAMAQVYQHIPLSAETGQKQLLSYPELYHDVFMEPDADQAQVYQDLHQWLKSIGMTHPSADTASVLPVEQTP